MTATVRIDDVRADAQATVPRHEWAALCADFRASIAMLSDDTTGRLSGLTSLQGRDGSSLRDTCQTGLTLLVAPVEERRPLTHTERYVRVATDTMKSQGAQLNDVLQAWHHLLDVLRGWARECTPSYTSGVELAFLDIVVPYVTEGMAISASRYAVADTKAIEESQMPLFVHGALTGQLAHHELRARCQTYGLDPDGEYRVLRACTPDEATARVLRDWLAFRTGRRGVVAVIEGGVWGFVPDLPELPWDHVVGVSGPVRLDKLSAGFRQASRAMLTAAALGSAGVQSMQSLGIYPAVLEDSEVGAGLIDRYLAPFLSEGDLGVELLRTVQTYLAHNCHATNAATALVVHPNTVRYRVRRFETGTDSSLGDTATLVEVWWALETWRLKIGLR